MKQILLTLLCVATIFCASADENGIDNSRVESIVNDTIRPVATFTPKGSKYRLTASGNINVRANYDFNGTTNHHDFIPSNIPTPATHNSDHRFYLDGTTSRVEIKGLTTTEKYGDMELCLNADFRGGAAGSYTPRVRFAYFAAAGFMVGRNFTTFCDLNSMAPNIDFEGPTVCAFVYATQIRYVKTVADGNITLGAALEYNGYKSVPVGTETAPLRYLEQQENAPNIPAYVQFNLGENSSHIRVTGLYKSIPLYDSVDDCDVNINGWGAQLSGNLAICPNLRLYYSGTYGEGISFYMQDIYGVVRDVTFNDGLAATKMYGWQASTLVQITPKMIFSTGYSVTKACGDRDLFQSVNEYRQGEYAFANIFYTLSPRIQLSAEYIWGKRTNLSGVNNRANRINTMVQYNF